MIRLFPLAVLAGGAFFHTHLASSFPRANEVVAVAPAEITLTFSARPEVPLTKLTLLRADSTPVKLDRVRAGRDTLTVAARVPGPLPVGQYIVVWRAASRDGHVVRGSYRFGYSTDRAAARPVAAGATPAQHDHK